MTFGLLGLALAGLAWLSLLGTWSVMPGLLCVTVAILLRVDGLGNAALAVHRLRQFSWTAGDG